MEVNSQEKNRWERMNIVTDGLAPVFRGFFVIWKKKTNNLAEARSAVLKSHLQNLPVQVYPVNVKPLQSLCTNLQQPMEEYRLLSDYFSTNSL